MRDRRLAANYAGALLSLLTDEAQADVAGAFLNALSDAIDHSAELRDLLRDPAVAKESRRRVLFALADAHSVPTPVKNFLGVVADHNRTSHLGAMAEAYRDAHEKRLGIVPVELTTAVSIDDDVRNRAAEALQRSTGQRVRLTCRTDGGLIGGAVARVGSRIYDGSLRTQLLRLRETMARG